MLAIWRRFESFSTRENRCGWLMATWSAPSARDCRSANRRDNMNGFFQTGLLVIRSLGVCVLPLALATTVNAQDTFSVSYATLSAAYMDHIVAMDKGYLKEDGLTVEVIRAPGGVASDGVLSGRLQFSSSAGSAWRA